MLGRKRHVLVDTLGLLLSVEVHAAKIQDRDGAETLLQGARKRFPFVERDIGDGGYREPQLTTLVARTGVWRLLIVERSDLHRFVVLPKRWIVERTLAWISRNLRLSRDYEQHTRKAAAFVRLAMIRIMLRRLAAHPQRESKHGLRDWLGNSARMGYHVPDLSLRQQAAGEVDD